MKKAILITLAVVLILSVVAGCTNGDKNPTTTTELSTTEPTGAKSTALNVTTTSLDDVSLKFPEEFTVQTGNQDGDYGFQRQYRFTYYGLSGYIMDLVSKEEYEKWSKNELKPYSKLEPMEPHLFSFIKKFNINFVTLEHVIKKSFYSILK